MLVGPQAFLNVWAFSDGKSLWLLPALASGHAAENLKSSPSARLLMRLVELEIRNLRSYRQEVVQFSDGITLLSGDIGAGKSTILAAIEFALFGISRGELSGAALLRHGVDEGAVRLVFEIEGDRYAVGRTLKRARGAVTQDAGWLETEGGRAQLTPSELRARIFQILGYPLHFLAKQRNLVYRSTVYTPQEEMKAILAVAPDERVETIRRLFGLDAYRTACDNAQLVARAIKDREVAAQDAIGILSQEIDAIRVRLAGAAELATQRESLVAALAQARERMSAAELRREQSERDRSALVAARSALAMAARQRSTVLADIQSRELALSTKQRARAASVAALAQARERMVDAPAVAVDVVALNAQIDDARATLERLRGEEGKLAHILAECEHGDPDVVAGAPCPTCRQIVSGDHLEGVTAALNAKSTAARTRLARTQGEIAAAQLVLQSVAASLDRARMDAQMRERIALLATGVAGLDADVSQLTESLARSREQLAALPPLQEEAALTAQVRAADEQVALALNAVRVVTAGILDVERSLARIDAAQEALVRERDRCLELERSRDERRERQDRDAALRSWLLAQFIPLAEGIERRVLQSVHQTFAGAFRAVMAQVLEDDTLVARLDATFTPILQQHGFDTDLSFLSGGERTAVALAYRLALVRAVHVLLPHLGTAGMVILDEPTEGFSREQLERVTDVLRSIGAGQLLIVSHDPVLEGFVDRVVRVRKNGDTSAIDAPRSVTESL